MENLRMSIMDFVIKLPKFARFDIVIIVVNLVSKRTYFIPIHIIVTIKDTIKVFLYNVWKLHSLSTSYCPLFQKVILYIRH